MKNEWFHFSNEQWDRLKKELAKYEKADGQGFASNVNMFIIEVENCCKLMPWLKSHQDLADHRAKLEKIEGDLKATVRDLKTMYHKNFNLIPQTHMDHTIEPGIKEWQKNTECSNIAYIAYGPLAKLLDIVQNAKKVLNAEKPSQGRPEADSQGLVTEMAKIFAKHIDKPTTYKDGAFVEVVRIILETLNLPTKDPSRAIRKAIKEIS